MKQNSQTGPTPHSPVKRMNTCPNELLNNVSQQVEILVTPNKMVKFSGAANDFDGKSPLISSGKASRNKRLLLENQENDCSAIKEEPGSGKFRSSAGKRDLFDSSAKKIRFCGDNAPKKTVQRSASARYL